MKRFSLLAGTCFLALTVAVVSAYQPCARSLSFHDGTGRFMTLTKQSTIDLNNPFFQSIGTNGRSCGTCHVASDAWSITPDHIKARFWGTNGQDPLFRKVDGTVCAESDTSTFPHALEAYSLLLEKGLIRVDLAIPADAEFQVMNVDDPYRCAPKSGSLSVYRRVLPSTNLPFLSTVMWDGRENAKGQSIEDDLKHQIISATTGHAEGQRPTDEQINAIFAFENATFTAQTFSKEAGRLDAEGGRGGPVHLMREPFFLGINDPLGGNPRGTPFDPSAMRLFAQFGFERGEVEADADERDHREQAQAAIRRGEVLFDTRQFAISNVAGLPFRSAPGTCTTCHDTPNVGDHSLPAPLNIGLTGTDRRTPDLPLFTLYCASTGQTIETTDPGRALITGKCADIGKFKGPILRALAARAPYFHNGSAANLGEVVEFYNKRFEIGLSNRDKKDLIAFLESL